MTPFETAFIGLFVIMFVIVIFLAAFFFNKIAQSINDVSDNAYDINESLQELIDLCDNGSEDDPIAKEILDMVTDIKNNMGSFNKVTITVDKPEEKA